MFRAVSARACTLWLLAVLGPGSGLSYPATVSAAETVQVTVLHTNDLHSHFRPEKTALGLGGVARLKTMIDRVRAEQPHTLLADGGDFSEGHIYYNAGAGLETIRMMDHLGYDVAVVGNHDWLNGPDVLLDVIAAAKVKMRLISANTSAQDYHRERDYLRHVHPYSIREVGGVKVAFIGISTYELIYDAYFKPIQIHAPFDIVRDLAKRLKRKADVVIGVSHNNIKMNEQILRHAPDVDFIVGAHDHKKLTKPVVVKRSGAKPGWVVEAGSWGRWLGRVDLEVTRSGDGRSEVSLNGYRLYQMDSTVPEDPETLARVERIEADLENHYGPVFHDHVCHSEIEANRDGTESVMGNLVADSVLAHTGADLALEQVNFVYGHIYRGNVTSADVYNSNPGIWDPRTDKAWTVHELPIRGRTLLWIFNLLFSSSSLPNNGILSAAGMEMIYNPAFAKTDIWPVITYLARGGQPLAADPFEALLSPFRTFDQYEEEQRVPVREIRIGGQPLRPDATYRLAASGGIVAAIRFLNSVIPNAVPLDGLRDTGRETWRVMADYLRGLGSFNGRSVQIGGRIRSEQEDLAVYPHEIRWSNVRAGGKEATADLEVIVRNLGYRASAASGVTAGVYGWKDPLDTTTEQPLLSISGPAAVPKLLPGESAKLSWRGVTIPGERGLYPVRVGIQGSKDEVNRSNDEATHWFSAPSI